MRFAHHIVTFIVSIVAVGTARAQSVPDVPGAPGGNTTTTTTVVPYFPGGVNPNTVTPGYGKILDLPKDSFTYKYGTNTSVVRGGKDSPIFTAGTRPSGQVPYEHVVRRGDTLSTIAEQYFQSTGFWPHLWSLNPQVQNPHWLYPGDVIRLREGKAPASAPGSSRLLDRKRAYMDGTVFLRTDGYIEDRSDEDWGELVGSPEDRMFLGTHDEVYVSVPKRKDVVVGQELTLFHSVRTLSAGRLVHIVGTVRVNRWEEKNHMARATVIEALDTIERGVRVGPVERKFDIVSPVPADRDLSARILATVYPYNFIGQNQVVFVDKGSDHGVAPGFRLRVYRRGDAWRRSLTTAEAGQRISHKTDGLPQMERTPDGGDERTYPIELVGELRVIRVKKTTAVCLVTSSRVELDASDVATMRAGY